MANENTYNTKYGAVSVSTDSSSNVTTLNLGIDTSKITVGAKFDDTGSLILSSTDNFATTVNASPIKGNTFGIKLTSTGSIITSSSDLTANTVEIDNDPTNTYGLASKKYVASAMNTHTADENAHSSLFNNLLKALTDLYEEKGELHAFKISDNYGNVINANGKCILSGDTANPKYIVFSDTRGIDFDTKFQELSGQLDDKQTKLTVGSDLSLTESGNLIVTDMRYDDTSIKNRLTLMESKVTYLQNEVNSLNNKLTSVRTTMSQLDENTASIYEIVTALKTI